MQRRWDTSSLKKIPEQLYLPASSVNKKTRDYRSRNIFKESYRNDTSTGKSWVEYRLV